MLQIMISFLLITGILHSGTLNLSSDLELSHDQEDNGTLTDNFINATAGIDINFENDNNMKSYIRLLLYDDSAGVNDSISKMELETLIFTSPIYKDIVYIKAGYFIDDDFGTSAFEDNRETWKAQLSSTFIENINIIFNLEKIKEANLDKNSGDTNRIYSDLYYSLNDYMFGLRFAIISNTDINAKRLSNKEIGLYAKAIFYDIEFNLELNKKVSDLNNQEASLNRVRGDGIFLSASKNINKFNVGLQYIFVQNGIDIGNLFEIGIITFGDDEQSDTLTSSSTKNSSILVIPIQYNFNKKLSLDTAILLGKNQGKNFNEFDIALSYTLNDNLSFYASYAVRDKYKIKKETFISSGLTFNWSEL